MFSVSVISELYSCFMSIMASTKEVLHRLVRSYWGVDFFSVSIAAPFPLLNGLILYLGELLEVLRQK